MVPEVMASFNQMLDVVGVTQHHDAITGTSLGGVAQYYKDLVHLHTSTLMKTYSEVVYQHAQKRGLFGEWEYHRQAGQDSDKEEASRIVYAIHNPSGAVLEVARIGVP